MTAIGGVRLARAVRVEHAVTGELVRSVRGVLEPPAWPGWIVAHRREHVLLITAEGFEGGEPHATRVALEVTDPPTAAVLTSPARSIVVPTGPREPGASAVHVERVDPAAMTLEVRLVDERDRPLRGAHVCARSLASDGRADASNDVSLAEAGGDGVYRSVARMWDRAHHPFAIEVDGVRVSVRHMQFDRWVTRIRLVVPSYMREPHEED